MKCLKDAGILIGMGLKCIWGNPEAETATISITSKLAERPILDKLALKNLKRFKFSMSFMMLSALGEKAVFDSNEHCHRSLICRSFSGPTCVEQHEFSHSLVNLTPLLINTSLGWKFLPKLNTLAYYSEG